MLIKQADTKLPERVEPLSCQLGLYDAGDPEQNPASILRWMLPVSPEDLMKVRNGSDHDYVAFPNVFTILHRENYDVLSVWPHPDKPYEAVLEYCPARKRI